MRAVDIIMKKRGNFASSDGGRKLATDTTLSAEEIKFLVQGYVEGSIPEYQISAFLMAVYFNGMTFEETGALTEIMLNSGEKIELHGKEFESLGLRGPFVDKHSTGGVGDKISLPLAPIVAACGVQIPMMSGRALGHTGGTLDKLDSISGYRTALSSDEFRRLIAKDGYAMTGQTEKVVPADRLLYALRDVTGTVESVPLITASILSKKVAEGSDALVFDVKCGSGAFMKSEEAANELAQSLVKTARAMGKKSAALITDMDSPLGQKIGNFLEIEETLDCLKGKGPSDVMDLTYALASQMLILGEKASSKEDALKKCREVVENGAALQKFLDNVESQGGDAQKMLSECSVRRSRFKTEIFARQDGFIKIDAYKTGLSGVYLGVGRNKTTDKVCAEAGIILHAKTGDAVKKGDALMEIFGKDEECLSPAKKILEEAISYSDEEISRKPLILKEII
ncbi:MAG: thymidine phosphorylase [Treponema sp.]|nr:thymidine phosphorylase [Treponema sp.]